MKLRSEKCRWCGTTNCDGDCGVEDCVPLPELTMQNKGYNYVIVFADNKPEPLFTKTIPQATKVLREDWPNHRFEIMLIETWIATKARTIMTEAETNRCIDSVLRKPRNND